VVLLGEGHYGLYIMLGWKIFAHSIGMVWRNLGAAARLSIGPILLFLAGALIVPLALALYPGALSTQEPSIGVLVVFGLGAPAAFALVIAAMVSFAVGWHRHVLLEIPVQGLFTPGTRSRLLPYLGRTVQIFVITALVVLTINGVIMVLRGLVIGQNPAWDDTTFSGVWSAAMWLIGTLIGYRLAPVLPATALGAPIGVATAWRTTRGANVDVVVMALLSVGLSTVLQLIAQGLTEALPLLGVLWVFVAGWFSAVLTISILTTIYGHFVEGRELA
jgi:hypothetical protein